MGWGACCWLGLGVMVRMELWLQSFVSSCCVTRTCCHISCLVLRRAAEQHWHHSCQWPMACPDEASQFANQGREVSAAPDAEVRHNAFSIPCGLSGRKAQCCASGGVNSQPLGNFLRRAPSTLPGCEEAAGLAGFKAWLCMVPLARSRVMRAAVTECRPLCPLSNYSATAVHNTFSKASHLTIEALGCSEDIFQDNSIHLKAKLAKPSLECSSWMSGYVFHRTKE